MILRVPPAQTNDACIAFERQVTPIEVAAAGGDKEMVSLMASLGSSLDFLSSPEWQDSPLRKLLTNPPEPMQARSIVMHM